MPEIILAPGTLTVSPADTAAHGVLYVQPSPPSPAAIGTLTVEDVVTPAARPRGDRPSIAGTAAHQHFGWYITVDGTELRPDETCGAKTITHTRNAPSTFELTCPIPSAMGTPWEFAGAAPGKAEINIYGRYLTTGGEVLIPQIIGGMVVNESRTSGPPALATYSGGDRELRYDREPVTFSLPPGHGLDVKSVVRRLMVSGDEPVPATLLALSGAERCYKEITPINETRFSFGREFLDAKNRVLNFSPEGLIESPLRIGCVSTARTECSLDESEISSGNGSSINGSADVITEICLTTEEQVIAEASICSQVPTKQVHEVWAPYQPRYASLRQQTVTGTLVAADGVSSPPALETRLVERVTTWRTYECGNLIFERILREAWYWPRAVRYYYALDPDLSTPDGYYACFIEDSGAATDDDAEAFAVEREQFLPVSLLEREYRYTEFDSGDKFLTEIVENEAGWFVRRHAVKVASTGVSWDAINYTGAGGPSENRAQLLDGDGVYDRREYWFGTGMFVGGVHPVVTEPLNPAATFPLRRTITGFDVTADGFVSGSTVTTYSWEVPPGGVGYLYADGSTSPNEFSEWLVREETTEQLTANDDDTGHSALRTITRLASGTVVENDTGLSGYLPAATKWEEPTPPDGAYQAGDDYSSKAASWYKKRQIEVEVSAPGLLDYHYPRKLKATPSPWAENIGELQSQALRMLREGCSVQATITQAGIDLTRRVNTLVAVRSRPIELDHIVEVETVTHSDPGRPVTGQPSPALTTFAGFVSIIE